MYRGWFRKLQHALDLAQIPLGVGSLVYQVLLTFCGLKYFQHSHHEFQVIAPKPAVSIQSMTGYLQ